MRRLIAIVVSILITLLALEFQAQTPPAQTQKPPQAQAPQTPPAQTQKPPQAPAPPAPPAQTPPPAAAAKPPAPDPPQLAEDWMTRWHNLANYSPSFEGKEVGAVEVANRTLAAYVPAPWAHR